MVIKSGTIYIGSQYAEI